MIWIWLLLVLVGTNFLMKDANAPFVRIIVTLIIFIPLFFSVSAFYSGYVGESMFRPMTLTVDLFKGFYQLILTPQFSFKFDLFGESVNTCVSNSTCTI